MAAALLAFDITKSLEENFINLVKSANEGELYLDLINMDNVALLSGSRITGNSNTVTVGGETIILNYQIVVKGLPTGPLRGQQTIQYRRLHLNELNIPSLVGNGGDWNNMMIPGSTVADRLGIPTTDTESTATAFCNNAAITTFNEFDKMHMNNYLKLHPKVNTTAVAKTHPNEGYTFMSVSFIPWDNLIHSDGTLGTSVFYHGSYDHSDFGERGRIDMNVRRGL